MSPAIQTRTPYPRRTRSRSSSSSSDSVKVTSAPSRPSRPPLRRRSMPRTRSRRSASLDSVRVTSRPVTKGPRSGTVVRNGLFHRLPEGNEEPQRLTIILGNESMDFVRVPTRSGNGSRSLLDVPTSAEGRVLSNGGNDEGLESPSDRDRRDRPRRRHRRRRRSRSLSRSRSESDRRSWARELPFPMVPMVPPPMRPFFGPVMRPFPVRFPRMMPPRPFQPYGFPPSRFPLN